MVVYFIFFNLYFIFFVFNKEISFFLYFFSLFNVNERKKLRTQLIFSLYKEISKIYKSEKTRINHLPRKLFFLPSFTATKRK